MRNPIRHCSSRMYFLMYESLIHRDTSKGMKREDIPAWRLCLYGALYPHSRKPLRIDPERQCGCQHIRWALNMKITLMADVIKTRLQTDIIGAGQRYSSALDCAIQSYRAEGLGTFFRGIGPTLARAAPVNAMVSSHPDPTNTRHS